MNHDTLPATITLEDIAKAEAQHADQLMRNDLIERIAGTIESYGSYPYVKPKLAKDTL